MKPIHSALAIVAFAGVAVAQDAPVVTDTDGNGTYSMEELVVVFPAITAETFTTIDLNADGAVDADELASAMETGTLVPTEG